MTGIPVPHLMNIVGYSSIGRIVQRLVAHRVGQDYSWHVRGVRGLGDMQEEFVRLGAQVVDFPDHQKRIREYGIKLNLQRLASQYEKQRGTPNGLDSREPWSGKRIWVVGGACFLDCSATQELNKGWAMLDA